MARALTCDRCGVVLEEEGPRVELDVDRFRHFETVGKPPQHERLDLCDHCTERALTWIRAGAHSERRGDS